MAYYDAWLLSSDQDFLNRCGMAAESEGLGFDWGVDNRYSLASAPGFADDYAYALQTGVPNPGRAQEVISDPELLSAIQVLNAGGTAALVEVEKGHRFAPEEGD